MNLIQSMYFDLILKLKSDSKITLDLNNSLQPEFTSIYDGGNYDSINIDRKNIATGEKRIEFDSNYNNVLPDNDYKNATSKIHKIVFPLEYINKKYDFDEESIYLFEYSNKNDYYKILDQYNEILFNKKICTVLINQKILLFLRQCINETTLDINIKIQHIGPYWLQATTPVLFIFLAIIIYFTGKKMILSYSKLDPILADFDITSSQILKFENVIDKNMPTCTICFEEFVDVDEVRMLNCMHYYHPECIDRWLIGHSKKCPCCRNLIDVNEK